MDLPVLSSSLRRPFCDEPKGHHEICTTDSSTTIVFGDKSVIIPGTVEESFDELSEILRSKDILAEVIALGITLKIDANTEKVVEVCHVPRIRHHPDPTQMAPVELK